MYKKNTTPLIFSVNGITVATLNSEKEKRMELSTYDFFFWVQRTCSRGESIVFISPFIFKEILKSPACNIFNNMLQLNIKAEI